MASALAFGLTSPVFSEDTSGLYGVIVGVSDYDFLDADLNGPANDVGLVAATLLARGASPDHLTVLAEASVALDPALSVASRPTKAAIMAALADMAAQVGPGDTVVFYFSGHGSQAPDASGDEAGGYDEIFLPADAKNWRGAIGAVENAILDDEMAVAFQAIMDTGAKVVGIVDACHSATGFRALGGQGVARYIDPAALSIPPAVENPDAVPGADLSGEYVFLYSSQSDQRSFEYPLGDREDPANWYGDFTRSLMGVLQNAPTLSWQQAMQVATDQMQGGTGGAVQTPDAEGPLLASAVFGDVTPPPLRFAYEGGKLAGGLLNGLREGAEVALFDAAVGGAQVATATIQSADADTARLTGLPASALPDGLWAEVTNPGPLPNFGLTAILNPNGLPDPGFADALALIGADAADAGLRMEAPLPDATLILTPEGLAIAGADGVLDPAGPMSSPRVTDPADLAAALDRAARAHRLRAALGRAEGAARTGFTLPGAGLKVTATRIEGKDAGANCVTEGAEVAFKSGDLAADCDQIWLALSNSSSTAQDVTVLYIDRDNHVSAIWPAEGLSNRIAFGETQDIGLQIVAGEAGFASGQEEIIVIAVPAKDNAPRTVLTALADQAPARALGGEDTAMSRYLLGVTDPVASRAFTPGGTPGALKVTKLRVTLAPRVN